MVSQGRRTEFRESSEVDSVNGFDRVNLEREFGGGGSEGDFGE